MKLDLKQMNKVAILTSIIFLQMRISLSQSQQVKPGPNLESANLAIKFDECAHENGVKICEDPITHGIITKCSKVVAEGKPEHERELKVLINEFSRTKGKSFDVLQNINARLFEKLYPNPPSSDLFKSMAFIHNFIKESSKFLGVRNFNALCHFRELQGHLRDAFNGVDACYNNAKIPFDIIESGDRKSPADFGKTRDSLIQLIQLLHKLIAATRGLTSNFAGLVNIGCGYRWSKYDTAGQALTKLISAILLDSKLYSDEPMTRERAIGVLHNGPAHILAVEIRNAETAVIAKKAAEYLKRL